MVKTECRNGTQCFIGGVIVGCLVVVVQRLTVPPVAN